MSANRSAILPAMSEAPELSDLYESNYIRQKADGILVLWRDENGDRRAKLAKAKDGDGNEGSEWDLPSRAEWLNG